jgi:hypothetical protein
MERGESNSWSEKNSESNNFISLDSSNSFQASNDNSEKIQIDNKMEENLNLDFRMAIKKESMMEEESITKKLAEVQNHTGTTLNETRNNFQEENLTSNSLKGKKIFRIKKYVKYNKFLSEICSDEELSESDKKELKEPKAKKISPFSKVNFSKLKAEEKDERLKNLAKLVKRLRRKVRNLENKVRFNPTKLLNKHIWNKLGINSKNKYLQPEFQFDFDKICKALRKVRNFDEFEFDDQKHLIENIINLVADDKLKIGSITYKKVCSILRPLIAKEKIKYISKKDSKITISFPETEVYISNKEYSKIARFKDNEEILRAVLGTYDENEKTIKVISEPPQETNNNLSNNLPTISNNINNNLNNDLNSKLLQEQANLGNTSQSLFSNSNMNNLLFARGLNNNMANLPGNPSQAFIKSEMNPSCNTPYMPYNNMLMMNMQNTMPSSNNLMGGNLNMNLYNNMNNNLNPGLSQNLLQNSINHNMPQGDQSMIFAQNTNNQQFQQFLMQSFKNYYAQNHSQPQPIQNKFMMGTMPNNGLNFNGLMGISSSNMMLNENNLTNPTSLQNLTGPSPKSSDNNTNNMLIK